MTGSKMYRGLITLGLILCLPTVAFFQEPQGFPGLFSGEFGSVVGWQRALRVLETAVQAAENEEPPYYVPSTSDFSIHPLYDVSRVENIRVSIPFLDDWLVEVVIEGQVTTSPGPVGVPINVPKVFAPAIEERNAATPFLLVDSFSEGFAALEKTK